MCISKSFLLSFTHLPKRYRAKVKKKIISILYVFIISLENIVHYNFLLTTIDLFFRLLIFIYSGFPPPHIYLSLSIQSKCSVMFFSPSTYKVCQRTFHFIFFLEALCPFP